MNSQFAPFLDLTQPFPPDMISLAAIERIPMDTNYRLKIKIGQNEFEAEGPIEVVQQQFEAFKQLVADAPSTPSQIPFRPFERSAEQTMPPESPSIDVSANAKSLSKIMRVDGRLISLTVRPDEPDDVILLLLYGQKELRQNDSVTGSEIMEGLTSTGGFSYVKRVDRYLENLAKEGMVIVIGEHRAKRYRLTNAGYSAA